MQACNACFLQNGFLGRLAYSAQVNMNSKGCMLAPGCVLASSVVSTEQQLVSIQICLYASAAGEHIVSLSSEP